MSDNEPKRCGAKTRSGEPCKNPPTTGRTRCRMHGGSPAQPRGVAHWNFKHGAYSKALKEQPHTLEAYQRALNDPYLASMADEMALAQARLMELLSNEDWDAAYLWIDQIRKLAVAKNKYDVLARRAVPVETFMAFMIGLKDIIETHVPDPDMRDAIFDEMILAIESNAPD